MPFAQQMQNKRTHFHIGPVVGPPHTYKFPNGVSKYGRIPMQSGNWSALTSSADSADYRWVRWVRLRGMRWAVFLSQRLLFVYT